MKIIVPPDVPIHRPSVGAMGWMGNPYPNDLHHLFKPYVYRGTGEDQFPETEPKPKPKKRKPKPRREYTYRPPPRRRFRIREASRPKPLDINDVETWGNWPRVPTPEPEPKPEPVYQPPTKPIRPAPGWKSMTGADIDDLLNELEG